jgi:repressor LexA
VVQSRQDKVYEFFVAYLKAHGFVPSIREIGEALGLRSTSTVHYHLTGLAARGLIQWEVGKNRAIRVLARHDDVPDDAAEAGALLGPGCLPVLGSIAAGAPIDAIALSDEVLNLPQLFADPDLFVLKVKGQSMIGDHIDDGDWAVIKRQNVARDGDIVVALLEDGDVTLKRIYREADGVIRLQPSNAAMAPLYVRQVVIQGKFVGLIRRESF